MRNRLLFLAAVCVPVVLAQMPSPAPELKRLQYFAGDWHSVGEMKPGPMGPGGKLESDDHYEWYPGNFFLVMHSEGKSPMGAEKDVAYFGYNTDMKKYTFDEFTSMGGHAISHGTVQGKTWNWTSEEKMNGQTMYGKVTIKELSATEYSFDFEMSTDKKTWSKVIEMKSTKK